jgi:polygalacturonase
MPRTRIERRSFLKNAAQAVLAGPAVSALTQFAQAQPPAQPSVQQPTPKPGAAAKPAAHPHAAAAKAPAKPVVMLNVRDFGATGDGKTKDTAAIQQTLDRCSVLGGGEVLVPAGNYLTGSLALRTRVLLRLAPDAILTGSPDLADYPLTQVRWEGMWIQGHAALVYALDAEETGIVGPGKLVGDNAIGGRPLPAIRRPAIVETINCKNVRFEDFSTSYYHMWSIHPTLSSNVVFKNLTIRSTGTNGDGIDVDSCQHVVIDTCDIQSGDDCIAIKSGRGEEAAAQIGVNPAVTTDDVLVTNCTLSGVGFACVAIGSETSGGIRNVRIEHCKMVKTRTHAIFIKSKVGRGAFLENISANDLDVTDMGQGFLQISLLTVGIPGAYPVPGEEGIPVVKNFRFSNIRVSGVPSMVDAIPIDSRKPLDGFSLSNVTGTCGKGIFLTNTKNAHISGIKVTGFTGPLLSLANVTGTGLAGATTIESPKPPDVVPEPATPYQLH